MIVLNNPDDVSDRELLLAVVQRDFITVKSKLAEHPYHVPTSLKGVTPLLIYYHV